MRISYPQEAPILTEICLMQGIFLDHFILLLYDMEFFVSNMGCSYSPQILAKHSALVGEWDGVKSFFFGGGSLYWPAGRNIYQNMWESFTISTYPIYICSRMYWKQGKWWWKQFRWWRGSLAYWSLWSKTSGRVRND